MADAESNVGAGPSPTAPGLTNLISSYAMLPTLARWLSTVDLYHLALTNRCHFSHILSSPHVFERLRRQCLCDGRGLIKRQEFRRPYFPLLPIGLFFGRKNPGYDSDEEIEVHLYNVRCDEADALPCIKCDVNICEECRFYPRAAPSKQWPERRPHLSADWSTQNIMCLCPPCDAAAEEQVTGKFLSQLCDCDRYARWICTRCAQDEEEFTEDYFKRHTFHDMDVYPDPESDPHGYPPPTKTMREPCLDRGFWCLCGATVDDDTRPRCTWCKRRHLPEMDWMAEFHEAVANNPLFDNNPDYPRWVSDRNGKYPTPYPRLGYRRPGDDY